VRYSVTVIVGLLALVLVSGASAQAGFAQENHPAYLKALEDLRAARWLLQQVPPHWVRANDELNAIRSIDEAIAQIRRESIDDGRDANFNPRIDEKPDRPRRLQDVQSFLGRARADIEQEPDTGRIRGLRGRAAGSIEAALAFVGNAQRTTSGPEHTVIIEGPPPAVRIEGHPAYLNALADLRAARWLLQDAPGTWVRVNDEGNAIAKIDEAIAEIRRSSFDDGRSPDFNPGIVENADHAGRLFDADNFLRRARADLDQEADAGAFQGLRGRAAAPIEAAMLFTEDAMRSLSAQAAPAPAPSEADWVTIFPSSGSVPVGAFKAGVDNGGPLYIVRTVYQGGLVVGKYNPLLGKALFPFGGQEVEVTNSTVEIYVGYGSWVFEPDGNPPPNAMVAGSENDGAPLLIIQGRWMGTVTCGKYSVEFHRGYFPYGGQEIPVSTNLAFLVPDDAPDSH